MLAYLDTNIWIYAYENDPIFGTRSRLFFQSLRAGKSKLASSLFVLSELLVLPTRTSNRFATASYQRLFTSPEIILLNYDLASAQLYADLRATHRLKPLDAVHLAVAASAEVDRFVTEDTLLLGLTVPGIKRITNLATALS